MAISMLVDGEGYTHFYTVDKLRVPRTFTPKTDEEEVHVFHVLLNTNELEVTKMVAEYHDRVQWNYESKGKGKNWPIFGKLERYLDRLQKQAGIIDT